MIYNVVHVIDCAVCFHKHHCSHFLASTLDFFIECHTPFYSLAALCVFFFFLYSIWPQIQLMADFGVCFFPHFFFSTDTMMIIKDRSVVFDFLVRLEHSSRVHSFRVIVIECTYVECSRIFIDRFKLLL